MKKAWIGEQSQGISEVEEYIPRKDLKGGALKVASKRTQKLVVGDREPLRGLSLRYLTPGHSKCLTKQLAVKVEWIWAFEEIGDYLEYPVTGENER